MYCKIKISKITLFSLNFRSRGIGRVTKQKAFRAGVRSQLEEVRADAIACTQFRRAHHSRFVVDPHDTATRAEVQLRHNGAAGLDDFIANDRSAQDVFLDAVRCWRAVVPALGNHLLR